MIRGLDLGADDFVSKPVSPAHLVARVRAIRRRSSEAQQVATGVLYQDDELSINASTHEVARGGKAIALTPTEFRLLVHLAQTPNHVHTSEALLAGVWGPEYVDDIDFLRVYMWRLRRKLEPDPPAPRWLQTERGFGYRFVGNRQAAG